MVLNQGFMVVEQAFINRLLENKASDANGGEVTPNTAVALG